MQNARKDILFFSNFCEYCNDILNLLIKKNIKQDFMMVCVDNNKYNIPSFVDRVPILYTKNDEIISDETIINYIESLYPTDNTDILPYSLQQSNYSNQFSFLEDTHDLQNKGYTMLGYEQKITAPIESEDSSSKTGKFDSSLLDKYRQSRDIDENNFKKIMNNGNGAGFNRV